MKKLNKTSKFFILVSIVLALSVVFSCAAFGAESVAGDEMFDAMIEAVESYRWNIEGIKFVETSPFTTDEEKRAIKESWNLTSPASVDVILAISSGNLEDGDFSATDVRYDLYVVTKEKLSAPEDMSYFFSEYKNVKTISGLDKFDTSAVKNMKGMFADCAKLKELDLSSFKTANVTNMSYMFKDCNAMEKLDVSGFNTEKVTLMNHMFSECSSLKELHLGSFNTKKVTDTQYMFSDCENLRTIYVGNDWIFLSAKSSNNMFQNCFLLEGKTAYNPVMLDVTYASTEYYTVHESVLDGVPLKLIFMDTLKVGQEKKIKNYTGFHYYSFIDSCYTLDPDVVVIEKIDNEYVAVAVGTGRAEIATTLKNVEGEITFIFNVDEGDKMEVEGSSMLGDILAIFKHWFQRIIDLFTGKLKIF